MPVELISLVKPKTSGGGAGEFPIAEDVDVKGGYQVRADTADRDSIYDLNRKEGMLVLVLDVGKYYTLQGGITNLDWVEVTFGGGTVIALIRAEFAAAAFVHLLGPNISQHPIVGVPSPIPGLLDLRDLWRNGILMPTMVAGVPAAPGEWRLFGGNLEVFGNVTASGDDYTIRYPI
jgi:hypothetical protein